MSTMSQVVDKIIERIKSGDVSVSETSFGNLVFEDKEKELKFTLTRRSRGWHNTMFDGKGDNGQADRLAEYASTVANKPVIEQRLRVNKLTRAYL